MSDILLLCEDTSKSFTLSLMQSGTSRIYPGLGCALTVLSLRLSLASSTLSRNLLKLLRRDGFAKTSAFVSGPRPTIYDSVQTLLQSFLPNELRSMLGGIRARKDWGRGEAVANQTHCLVWEVLHQPRWATKAFRKASSPSPCRTWWERIFVCTLWCFLSKQDSLHRHCKSASHRRNL